MRLMIIIAATGFVAAALLAGCANNDGLGLTTASLEPARTAAKPSIDPACVTLAAKINEARAEGTPGRVADVAAAENKPRIVNIKRTSLAKVTELDAMNKEFQARCSTVPTQSAAAPAAAHAPVTAAQTAVTGAATNAAQTAATSAANKVAAKAVTNATTAATRKAQSSVTASATPTILNAAAAR
jgi:hypothetical protein